MSSVFLAVCVFAFLLCVVIGIRNEFAYRFMSSMMERVYAAGIDDEDKHWAWRMETLRSVSYYRVVFQFWKPLNPEAFWEDTSFLDPNKHAGDSHS